MKEEGNADALGVPASHPPCRALEGVGLRRCQAPFPSREEKMKTWIPFIFKDFIYLFLEKREGRENDRDMDV